MHRKPTIADLFDAQGHLKPVHELAANVAAQVASFDVVRITTRRDGDSTITEELIRIALRGGTKAAVTRPRSRGRILAQVMTRTGGYLDH